MKVFSKPNATMGVPSPDESSVLSSHCLTMKHEEAQFVADSIVDEFGQVCTPEHLEALADALSTTPDVYGDGLEMAWAVAGALRRRALSMRNG